jgi:hypothetical protein
MIVDIQKIPRNGYGCGDWLTSQQFTCYHRRFHVRRDMLYLL